MIRLAENEDSKFLMAAMADRHEMDSKYRLDVICSTEVEGCKVLACTDSRRLHVINNYYDDIKPGVYSVVHDKRDKSYILDKIDARFPEIQAIFSNACDKTTEETSFYNSGNKKDTVTFSSAVASLFHSFKGIVNLKYLQDLGSDPFDVWFNNDNPGPLYFINHSKVALLMPIRF